jgi:DNA-binding phage protein
MRDPAEARGLAHIARVASLNRENMDRILSEKGKPRLSSNTLLLDSLGLRWAVEVKDAAA